MPRLTTKLTSGLGIALVLTLMAAAPAEARRGGSFGSRGARTYVAPKATNTAPQQTAPVQRSMTAPPPAGAQAPAARPAAQPSPVQTQAPRRGGFLGGIGGGILGGLLAGGLIGMLMGNGFGAGMAGFMGALLQIALIAGVVWLLFALFRRRKPAQAAYAGGASPYAAPASPTPGFDAPRGGYVPASPAPPAPDRADEVGLTQRDLDTFERLLAEVQAAFSAEDYGALRERTTPEIMSYLSEELSQNAVAGRRNEVSGTRLLQADIAEAWAEGRALYATAALRYESIDVMRDRQSGEVLSGDPAKPTETTELWTFVQDGDEPWKLSAIQEA